MKVTLAQKHVVKGLVYGPGDVDVDEETHAVLDRRGAFLNPLVAFPPLIAAGYTALADAKAQDDDTLLKIPGVGPAMLNKIREA